MFHRSGRPIKDFRVSWATACKKVGLVGERGGVIPHDLRRCAARNLSRAVVREQVAMRITGHKTFARSVSSRITVYGKDQAVRKARQTAADLELRVQELQAENAQLKTDHSYPFESPHRTPVVNGPILQVAS